jgi:hypothetical protein
MGQERHELLCCLGSETTGSILKPLQLKRYLGTTTSGCISVEKKRIKLYKVIDLPQSEVAGS